MKNKKDWATIIVLLKPAEKDLLKLKAEESGVGNISGLVRVVLFKEFSELATAADKRKT